MKRLRKIVITLAALCAVAAGGVCLFLFSRDAVVAPGLVCIPSGSTYGAVVDSLRGRIRSVAAFEAVARAMKYDRGRVRGGVYDLRPGTGYRRLVGMLRGGAQSPVRVTFNNMRTLPQLAGRVAQQLEADSASLLRAMTDPSAMERYGLDLHTMPAIFLPDTYELYWTTGAEAFVDRMKSEWGSFWTAERTARAEAVGLSPVEVSTLASIVYEETKQTDEMPRVAGVYLNRLRTGMPLQADPTLKFALGDFAIKRVLDRDKQVESPYNTYKYAGLPPGPICLPPASAIDGVLAAERHDYLYFCARPDYSGYHAFSATLAGHNANARKYREFLDREQIYR